MPSSLIRIQYCYDYLVNQIPTSLLFYTHLSIIIVTLIFSVYLLYKVRNLTSILLFGICLSFVIWALLDLTTWFSFLGSGNTMFAWELMFVFTLIFFFFSYYFLYVFTTGKDLPRLQKLLSVAIMTPNFIWVFSGSSLTLFDGNICEALEKNSVNYFYFSTQAIFLIAVIILTIHQYHTNKDNYKRKENLYAGIGVIFFLSFFLLTMLVVNIFANYDFVQYAYNFSIYGLLGMPVLLGFLVYLIVKFKAFNIKLFATQALIWGLVILIGSQFFFITGTTNLVLNSITFVGIVIVGQYLIRSVKIEIDQRERLEQLRLRLEQANMDLGDANEKLKSLDKLKTEFVSLASHQLRSPLTAIKGYTSMLIEGDYGEINPQAKDTIERIMESSNNLTLVVEDLLNVAKIEQGGMKYEMTKFDFGELARDTAKDLSITAERKNLKLIYDISEDQNYFVNGDKEKLRQILVNLIDNSMKYTKEGQIEVRLESKNNKIMLTIKDTGVGISKDVIETLFQKFSRGDGAKMNTSGSGLGLYLVKEIVEAHKGHVWVESSGVGQGSTFFVELDEVK